jgi:peptidoglycan/xylan/chitin deacetylase (PgdA/CDA1 family)
VGENAGYYKDTLMKISNHGHELGNHTFSHAIIKDKNALDIIAEVEDCRNTIYEICGENTVLFRPPGGIMADVNAEDAELFENYDIILWSIDTMDWAHHPPEQIAQYVINATKAGDIILMHDYIGSDSPTPKALEIIIPCLIERGYDFVTVSDLISS